MPEKPPEKKSADKKTAQSDAEPCIAGNDAARQEDQKSGSYYYDDACGYEIYNPEEEEDQEETEQEPSSDAPKAF